MTRGGGCGRAAAGGREWGDSGGLPTRMPVRIGPGVRPDICPDRRTAGRGRPAGPCGGRSGGGSARTIDADRTRALSRVYASDISCIRDTQIEERGDASVHLASVRSSIVSIVSILKNGVSVE